MGDRAYVGEVQARRQVNGLVLVEAKYAAPVTIDAHPHSEAVACLVLNGTMTERWGPRSVECAAGHTTYLAAHEPHGQEYHQGGSRSFFIHFDPAWSDRMRNLGVEQPRVPVDLRRTRVDLLASRIHEEFRTNDPASALTIEGLALTMIGEITRAHQRVERAPHPHWLRRATAMLQARMHESVTMADVATEVGVHPTHLAQTFRDRHGCTMGDYLRRIRIERAQDALRTTDKPLATIALETGFSDQSHFSRVFKRLTGTTPGTWRHTHRRGRTVSVPGSSGRPADGAHRILLPSNPP